MKHIGFGFGAGRIASIGIIAVVLTVSAESLAAQESAAEQGSWRVLPLPHVDLWYHGLAVTGFEGSGPDPLYDPSYRARIREVEEGLGVYPSALDRGSPGFAAAFQADSAFELLHFVPLYFASAGPDRMLSALTQVGETGNARVEDPAAQFGAGIVAQLLPEERQRDVLLEFTRALSSEWATWFEDAWTRSVLDRRVDLAALQSVWDERFAGPLRPYLERHQLDQGALIVSPQVGLEGRVFSGSPADRTDNLVVVHFPPRGDRLEATLHYAVRELCFPAARLAMDAAGPMPTDRLAASARSTRAAVRCGDLLLERVAPGEAAAYRRSFVPATASASDEATREAFHRAYPLDAGLEVALAAEIANLQ
ncbi:MAG: hypothetical protein WBN79_10135 [Gemmatimonadota bacterium]